MVTAAGQHSWSDAITLGKTASSEAYICASAANYMRHCDAGGSGNGRQACQYL